MAAWTTAGGLDPAIGVGTRVFIVDQLSKSLALEQLGEPMRVVKVTPFLNLALGFNTGVGFGLFRNDSRYGPWLLAALSLVAVVLPLVWAARSHSRLEGIALGAIAGGGLGNAFDRLRQGAVTDVIDLHAHGWHWPAFNVADIGISVGVGLLLLAGLRPAPAAPQAGQPADRAAGAGASDAPRDQKD